MHQLTQLHGLNTGAQILVISRDSTKFKHHACYNLKKVTKYKIEEKKSRNVSLLTIALPKFPIVIIPIVLKISHIGHTHSSTMNNKLKLNLWHLRIGLIQ